MGKRWQSFKAVVSTTSAAYLGTPTNYGGGYLIDGTWITYLRDASGVVRIQSPLSLYGQPITRQEDGKWKLS